MPLASSSSSRSPPPVAYPRADKFTPRLPLDPFAADPAIPSRSSALYPETQPWKLDVDRLPPLHLTRLQRNVLLVLGDPTVNQLAPLLTSPHLISSLVIIAVSPDVQIHIPPYVKPAVRVLRLKSPIAIQDYGATRLVDVLEWAERLVRIWRHRPIHDVQELNELDHPHAVVHVAPSRRHNSYMYDKKSPGSSLPGASVLVKESPRPAPKSRKSSTALPPLDPSQQPFDVLINFLPATGIPDKALLKNAILVTTISRPFLIAASPMVASSIPRPRSQSFRPSTASDSRRWSFFKSSGKNTSSPSLAPPGISPNLPTPSHSASSLPTPSSSVSLFSNPYFASVRGTMSMVRSRIIHVVPSPPLHPHRHTYTRLQNEAKMKLVASIESFLLSFASSAALREGQLFAGARPYLVDSVSFSNDTINTSSDGGDWSLAEILLSGGLDVDPSNPEDEYNNTFRRAWMPGVSDLTFVGPSHSSAQAPSRSTTMETETEMLLSESRTPSMYSDTPPPPPPKEDQSPARKAGPYLTTTAPPSRISRGRTSMSTDRDRNWDTGVNAGGLPTPPDSDRDESSRGSPDREPGGKNLKRKKGWKFWKS
ncbi:hypothetical protein SISNIDRAFT_471101 [Sistotremastrum niveocremeum HHB9708]|uniref:Uncharacterized protein n=1 Tax=Sistotremastrum niveocremeum HHB9708 TaxID=1314777 RepID=A0A164N0X6_9AGAM|nr:hypothetical protein SISNIDRAFT_471101 [Sistotremastrum niveocremeum HHB9708]